MAYVHVPTGKLILMPQPLPKPDDLTVSLRSDLRRFILAIERVMPGIRFAHRSSTEVHALYPGDVYTVGRLVIDNSKYAVSAPSINNSRTPFMLRSSNMDTAVHNAKTHLRRYSPEKVVEVAASEGATALYDTVQKLVQTKYQKKHDLLDNQLLMDELRLLRSEGYKFRTPGLAEAFDSALTAIEAAEEVEKKSFDGYAVYPYEHPLSEHPRYLVTPVKEVANRYLMRLQTGEAATYTDADLPDGITGKIAVLSLTNPGTVVLGVGVRTEAGVYLLME